MPCVLCNKVWRATTVFDGHPTCAPCRQEIETARAQIAERKARKEAEDLGEVKCWYCNSRGVDFKNANGVWIHKDCE